MTSVRSIATSEGGRIWRVRRRAKELRLPWIPIMIMTILVVSATFAPVLSPHDPTGIDLRNAKMAPGKTWSHSLGTDVLGRDMLSRLIYGARTAVFISVVALGTGAVVGTSLGLISGYAGGAIDALIMRATDAALGFPTILLAMILVTVLGEGIQNIIIAVALTVWANFVRMIRGDVLIVKEMDFVTMSRIAGHSPLEITRRHIFPNVVNTLMVVTSLLVGQVILLEAALSFLGLGLPPGAPGWGMMVAEGRVVILDLWWLSLFPGVAITVVVLAFNFFGDWLRDTLDPKLSRI